MLIVPTIFIGIFSPTYQLIAISGCIFLIVLLPFWSRKEFDIFSPWAIICYDVFFTIFLCSIYITFDLPNPNFIREILLRGKPKEFLFAPSFYILLGVMFLTCGYLFTKNNRKNIRLKIFRSDNWDSRRYYYVLSFILLLSWVGLYYYIKYAIGGSFNENISAYRRIASTELSEYRSYGYLSWLVLLSNLVYQISWVKIISKIKGSKIWNYFLFLLSSATSIFFAFISGVRSGVVLWFVILLVLTYYIRNRKLNASFKIYFVIILLVVLTIFLVMTNMRQGNRSSINENINKFNIIDFSALFIAGGTGMNIGKTCYIIDSIPEKMDFQWGGTFITFLYAWIPREIWPNKPIAALDAIIAMKIYGAQMYGRGGIPPGMIAELYLNFWIIGIPFGCFLVGRLIKKINIILKEYIQNRNIIILYVISFMMLGDGLMGSGFVSTIIGFLMTVIPLMIILNLITKSKKSSSHL
jgi:oligosaccharide repeat unit polymerase